MVEAVGLSIRHKRFADEYIIDQNATQAALKAGFKGKNVAATACRLLKKPKISQYINARIEEIQANIEVTQEDIRKYWKKLMEDEKANHSDRLRASEYLAKEKGMFKETPSFVAMFQVPEVKEMVKAVDMSIRPKIEQEIIDCQLASKTEVIETQHVNDSA